MEVRKYKDTDYEEVSSLLYHTFGYTKEKMSDERVYEFVLEVDGKVVGYFNCMEEIDIIRNLKIFHIGYVCVDEACRGKGYGRCLMEYAISFAKENHVTRLELTSGNKRVAAHQLYLSLGFEKRDSSIFRKELL